MRDVFSELIEARSSGKPYSLYSVCSSNALVLETAIKRVAKTGLPVLVEATANQVNQDGGYTGMRSADFAAKLDALCALCGADRELVIFGGDHLGPYPWRQMQTERAMEKAEGLVRSFVASGARKIHLDASMSLGNDVGAFPEPNVVAERAARLCAAAEDEFGKLATEGGRYRKPVYVIGTEVPVPGGVVGDEDAAEEEAGPEPTSDESLRLTLELHEQAFLDEGLGDAWTRVMAVVVQPGLEFESSVVHPYKRARASALRKALGTRSRVFFEGHSTDYQSDRSLRALVEDGFAFLKVGPALTFALREALMGLSGIDAQINGRERSALADALLKVLTANDTYWKGYYAKDDTVSMLFSLSDRVRYYWDTLEIQEEVEKLFVSLRGRELEPGLISQYLPRIAGPHMAAALAPSTDPRALAMAAVDAELERYERACFPAEENRYGDQ